MKRFQIGDRTIVVIEGEVYEHVKAFGDEPATTTPAAKPKRASRPRRSRRFRDSSAGGLLMTEADTKDRLERSDIAHMKEMINAGYGTKEIADKYGVNLQYVYNIRARMKKSGELSLEAPTTEE
jgi:hypothetical protein